MDANKREFGFKRAIYFDLFTAEITEVAEEARKDVFLCGKRPED
jgi:hypothetical protein